MPIVMGQKFLTELGERLKDPIAVRATLECPRCRNRLSKDTAIQVHPVRSSELTYDFVGGAPFLAPALPCSAEHDWALYTLTLEIL